MNACISRKGEFSDHETLDERFCCIDCGAFIEQAVIDYYAGPVRRVEELVDKWHGATSLSDGTPSVVMKAMAQEVYRALRGEV